jgi:hypothetical protein
MLTDIQSGDRKESVNGGCLDISGVIRPLLEAAEVGDNGRIADDKSRILMSRFPTPLTSVYRRSKYTPKTAISATLGTFGAPSRRDGSLGNTLQHREIGHGPCSAGLFQTEWV